MTIKKLIGTDPNQIPLNRDLGSMAYINYKPENYQAASYGNYTMPSVTGTTVYHKVVLDQPLASSYGAVLFSYTIAGFLYLVNPNDHYSYFDGVFLAAIEADNTWRIQKIRETAITANDYPFTSISAINVVSNNNIANAALQFSLYSSRAGNTPNQSIRFLASVRRLVSSDGSSLTSAG